MPRRIILRNFLSPGDVVMLTAAVRDLHACNPGRFLTDVRTTARELWENNPHLTSLREGEPGVEVLQCHYPLIHRSNQTPYHFIHGFEQFLSEKLGVPVHPGAFKGDIHLSGEELARPSLVAEALGEELPFWIVVAGGKRDYTIKWWSSDRYQAVVDHFGGRILFVQVGEKGHHHPPLDGVLDLRGRTGIRELVHLVHRAQGVLCPVTFLMHLAAAVEAPPGMPAHRPCVVVAGGREPVHWEAYPHHQFLHTQGALACCQRGGCWKSRTLPLGDGDPKDDPANRCLDVAGDLPRCMDMITPRKVIEAIETYFDGGVAGYLESGKAAGLDLAAASREAAAGSGKLNGSARRGTPVKNGLTLRVAGLRRSGLHPVLNWLAGLSQGKVCFVNDINHQMHVSPEHRSDGLPAVGGSFNRAVRLDEPKDLLLLSFEDERLVHLRDRPPDPAVFGRSDRFRDVIVLRDPFNTFASRLHLMRQQPRNAFVKGFMLPDENGRPCLPRRWLYYAREYLGATRHLGHDCLAVNFNRWVADPGYRREISDALALPYRDEHRERVPAYGFGSSFDRRGFDHRGSAMDLSGRWEIYRDDPEYRALFADPEIFALSERIFGEVLDHGPILAALQPAPAGGR